MNCPVARTGIYAEEFVTPPAREADGKWVSEGDWINRAARDIGGMNALCVDTKNRACRIGAHFMRATTEGTYPIRFWYGEGGETKAEQRRSQAASRRYMRMRHPGVKMDL